MTKKFKQFRVNGEMRTTMNPNRVRGNIETYDIPSQDYAICAVWLGGVVIGVGKEWDATKPKNGKEEFRVRFPADAARKLGQLLIACADELDAYGESADAGEPDDETDTTSQ